MYNVQYIRENGSNYTRNQPHITVVVHTIILNIKKKKSDQNKKTKEIIIIIINYFYDVCIDQRTFYIYIFIIIVCTAA